MENDHDVMQKHQGPEEVWPVGMALRAVQKAPKTEWVTRQDREGRILNEKKKFERRMVKKRGGGGS